MNLRNIILAFASILPASLVNAQTHEGGTRVVVSCSSCAFNVTATTTDNDVDCGAGGGTAPALIISDLSQESGTCTPLDSSCVGSKDCKVSVNVELQFPASGGCYSELWVESPRFPARTRVVAGISQKLEATATCRGASQTSGNTNGSVSFKVFTTARGSAPAAQFSLDFNCGTCQSNTIGGAGGIGGVGGGGN